MRAKMPGDEDDPIAHQFASQRNCLLGVAEVVAHDEFDPLAENAAVGV